MPTKAEAELGVEWAALASWRSSWFQRDRLGAPGGLVGLEERRDEQPWPEGRGE